MKKYLFVILLIGLTLWGIPYLYLFGLIVGLGIHLGIDVYKEHCKLTKIR